MAKVTKALYGENGWREKFYRLANLVVKISGCAICIGLVWYAMRYTQFILPYGDEISLETKDSMWKNIVCFLVAGAFGTGLFWLEKKLDFLIKYRISMSALLIAMAWVGIWSFWWILSADRVPVGDQAYVYGAASYFQEGNYYFFGKGGYLGMFPYQMGLVLLMELLFLFVGPYNYFAFEVICALMAVGIVYLGYRVVSAVAESMTAKVLYCVFMMGCLPMVFYTSWVYGDLPSIFFALLAFDALLKYEKDKKKRWLVLLATAVILAMLVRQHSWIFVLALILAGGIHAVKKKDICLGMVLLSLLLLPQLVYAGIYEMYEIRSGEEKCEGIPYVATIAMGLQESRRGNGWYNNYHKDIYGQAEFDLELTSDIAKQEIRNRLKVFRNNPSYAVWFFKSKVLSQWNQPLCQSVYFNTNYDVPSTPPAVGTFADSISSGNFSKVLALADRMQFIIYVGMLAYFIFCLKRDSNLLHHVLVITMIGGFLFSIIWESKARYIFPYYVLMFSGAAIGYLGMIQKIAETIGKIRKPRQEDNVIEFRKIA